MTRIDILNYYHKLIKKSRSFFRAVRLNFQKLIEKLGLFFTAHLNIRRLDIFLIIAVIAVFVYVAVNHSCGAVNGPERTNITISSQGAHLFGRETVTALIQEFEKLNPELRIRETEREADIVFFDDSEFGELINISDIASRDSYRPLVSFMDLFIYNIDILQAANLDRPPKTRAEFLAAAKAVAENDAVFAFALGLSPEDPLALRRDFYPWIWASGVDINALDLSGDNPALPRPVADTIALLGELNREGLLAPETFKKTGTERLREFARGKIAMMTISARDLHYLRSNAGGITFGITALPAATQGKNRLGLSSIYAGISGASVVSDEAKVFLSFLVKKSEVLAEAIEAVPGSFPGGFAGEHITKDPLYAKAWELFEVAEIVEYKGGQSAEETFNRIIWEKLVEALKVEPPQVEPPKVEAPRVEPPRAETPRAEPPKVETPPAEAPKPEEPKVEAATP